MRRLLCIVGWHTPVYRKWRYHPGWTVTCQHCGKTKAV